MINLHRLIALISRQVLMVILSLSLFWGGIVILMAKISGWSLFFGLLIIPAGAVLTLFTIDEVAIKLLIPPTFKPTKCTVCGKTTFASEEKERVVCGLCREEETDELLKIIEKERKLSLIPFS